MNIATIALCLLTNSPSYIILILQKAGNVCFSVHRFNHRDEFLFDSFPKLHKSLILKNFQILTGKVWNCLKIVKWANFLFLTTNNALTAQNLLQRRKTDIKLFFFFLKNIYKEVSQNFTFFFVRLLCFTFVIWNILTCMITWSALFKIWVKWLW